MKYFYTSKSIVEEGVEIFEGVWARELYIDNKAMVLYVYLTNDVPMHSHPHLQMGFVLKGRAEFTIGESIQKVEPGTYYIMPSGVEHGVKLLGPDLLVIDIFIPPREDYIKKFKTK